MSDATKEGSKKPRITSISPSDDCDLPSFDIGSSSNLKEPIIGPSSNLLEEPIKGASNLSVGNKDFVSPRRLKAVIHCVPQTLPDDIVKLYGTEDKCRKRKLSTESLSSKSVKIPMAESKIPDKMSKCDTVQQAESDIPDMVIECDTDQQAESEISDYKVSECDTDQEAEELIETNPGESISDQNSPSKPLSPTLHNTSASILVGKPIQISIGISPVEPIPTECTETVKTNQNEQALGQNAIHGIKESPTLGSNSESEDAKSSPEADSEMNINAYSEKLTVLQSAESDQVESPNVSDTNKSGTDESVTIATTDQVITNSAQLSLTASADTGFVENIEISGGTCSTYVSVPVDTSSPGEGVSPPIDQLNQTAMDNTEPDTPDEHPVEQSMAVVTASNPSSLSSDTMEIQEDEPPQSSSDQQDRSGNKKNSLLQQSDYISPVTTSARQEIDADDIKTDGEISSSEQLGEIPKSPTLSELIGDTESSMLDSISNSAFNENNMFDFSSLREDTNSPASPMALDIVEPDKDDSESEEPILALSDSSSTKLSDKSTSRLNIVPDKMYTRNSGKQDKPVVQSKQTRNRTIVSDKNPDTTSNDYTSERRSSKRSTCTLVMHKKGNSSSKMNEDKSSKLPRKRKMSTSPNHKKSSRDGCKRSSSSETAPLCHSKNLDIDNKSKSIEQICEVSSEISLSDKFHDVKRTILDATRGTSGVDQKRYSHFCNIFLKNWRYSKQFSRNINARTKQILRTMLEKIIKNLNEKKLLEIKGPGDSIDIVRMILEEVKKDNSRIFSQTPPTLTVLVTEAMFEKYYSHSTRERSTAAKRSQVRTVSLGHSTDQWLRFKEELGMESHSEVAAILMHCYKAWTSVACSKCRRHMEIGMEQKLGRSLLNSETSVCIVSCECGKSTSGGFMIECDSCHKWQHGVCVDVQKDNIPAYYACKRCSNIRGSVVLSPAKDKDADSDISVISIDNTELCSTDTSEPEVIELD